jgi:nucleoside triphosphate diphosphatase
MSYVPYQRRIPINIPEKIIMDELNAKKIHGIERLKYIMERLRNPENGCPWDIEQTYESIAPYTIEEAYEVADAIDHKDMAALKDELGDLLLQVIYHTQMASEDNAFTFDDVVEAISEKMVRRHPHVFGASDVESAEQQTANWEDQKAKERAQKSDEIGVLGGVAKGLPALLRAFKLQKRAARVGFDWPSTDGAYDKLTEEFDELNEEIQAPIQDQQKLIDEFGDVLFSAVNLARKLEVDPEAALRQGNLKFETRFSYIEKTLEREGKAFDDVSLEDMETLWQEAKKKS